jgi:chloride channel protein, CIC family
VDLRKIFIRLFSKRSLAALSYVAAAVITGGVCVGFMRLFEVVLHHRLDLHSIGGAAWVVTPLGFLVIVVLIRRIAPFSAGTGIPQAVYAAEHFRPQSESLLRPLVSFRTLFMKCAALLAAIAVGASTGREGPTVHIAMCVFCLTLFGIRRLTGLHFDMRSAIVAGGAAGLAAAFNTPLAGVAFAIEELSSDVFHSMKEIVLIAIIVAAITAKAITGDYVYFGRLSSMGDLPLLSVVLISLAAGLLGALFSTLLWKGQLWIQMESRSRKVEWAVPVLFGLGLVALSAASSLDVMGPGNTVAKRLLEGEALPGLAVFPVTKMLSTLLTFWSGLAGGIFAPCLSIGAAVGSALSGWLHAPIASAALIGMAAFLAGTIQAPMTCFIIVFEMTNDHHLLLPTMLACLIAVIAARLTGSPHLYKTLASFYHDFFFPPIEPVPKT